MKRSAGLGFLFITLFLDVLGMGLLIPILPQFIQSVAHLGISAASRHYGALAALYGAMQFLFAPMLGRLSDRFGRRPVLLLSLLFGGVDYIIMALAPNLVWLYVGRTLSGITGASVSAASAYIADISPPEKRSQDFGLIGAAFGIGFIVGPALGGVLGGIGTRVPFWVAAGLNLANMLYGLFILPESHAKEHRRRFAWREANPMGALRILASHPILWGLTGALVVSNLAVQCLYSTWVPFTTARFGWGVEANGLWLAAFGIVMALYQMGLARVVLPWVGDRRMVLLGSAISSLEFAAYGLVTRSWMLYALIPVRGISTLSGQATQGLLSRLVDKGEQGALQGALASLASLTGVIGPIIATGLFSYFTRPGASVQIPGVAFFLGAVLNLIAFILSLRALARWRDHSG